jgi:hypothetical protein
MKTATFVSKRGHAPNVEVPSEQPSVNYKEFRAAYKATQLRRASEGKLVLPTTFNRRIR